MPCRWWCWGTSVPIIPLPSLPSPSPYSLPPTTLNLLPPGELGLGRAGGGGGGGGWGWVGFGFFPALDMRTLCLSFSSLLVSSNKHLLCLFPLNISLLFFLVVSCPCLSLACSSFLLSSMSQTPCMSCLASPSHSLCIPILHVYAFLLLSLLLTLSFSFSVSQIWRERKA